ncbi:hypothetical protein [Arthrobacter sp. 18067]|uniref:hypothetical protein n=1 Tax=Arthrobacter sp. 18067 TaxID=2681413 RepID=UPI00135BFCCE|nr:hypothetical protein [Arthrobacter sp. 18067]
MSQEPYCDHGPLDACRCLAPEIVIDSRPDSVYMRDKVEAARSITVEQISEAFRFSEAEAVAAGLAAHELFATEYPVPEPEPGPDAEDMHVYAHEFDPIGGFVCGECGTPTETEPCQEHQPIAYSRMT